MSHSVSGDDTQTLVVLICSLMTDMKVWMSVPGQVCNPSPVQRDFALLHYATGQCVTTDRCLCTDNAGQRLQNMVIATLSKWSTIWRDNMTTHTHVHMHKIPVCILCVASMIAFMPDAHTLLTVEQTVVGGRPAPKAACRAGACAPHTF